MYDWTALNALLTFCPPCAVHLVAVDPSPRWPLRHAPNSVLNCDRNNTVRLCAAHRHCGGHDDCQLAGHYDYHAAMVHAASMNATSIADDQRAPKNATPVPLVCQSGAPVHPFAMAIHPNCHVLWQNHRGYYIRSRPCGGDRNKGAENKAMSIHSMTTTQQHHVGIS